MHDAIHQDHTVNICGYGHMHVEATQYVAPSDDLKVVHDFSGTGVWRFDLLTPDSYRMGSRSHQTKTLLNRDFGNASPQPDELLDCLLMPVEHGRDQLDLRAQQFGCDGITKSALACPDQRARHIRSERSRLRMSEKELFFDTERVREKFQVGHRYPFQTWWGRGPSAANRCSCKHEVIAKVWRAKKAR